MSETLVVGLNADGLHTVTVPETFSASGEFTVVLENHGTPTRVHLGLDDALASAVELEDSHHYVTEGATERVPVRVAPDAEVRGHLTVSVSYGSTTAGVLVDLAPAEPEKPPVEVDESLGPSTAAGLDEPRPTSSPMGFDSATAAPALALGGVAVLLAGATLTVDGVAAVVLAVLAVLAAVVGAGYALYSQGRN
ncbi:hypothetical protein ACFQPA_06215 [Halomarina halobia]|uniref:Uncharacterized protein n=1 Tax=Halomarina halobia TaxID=3033386 RepID=A0ABD6A7P8_9EURY|nr:hypothetical protein [Halomarina sp. PSR21]